MTKKYHHLKIQVKIYKNLAKYHESKIAKLEMKVERLERENTELERKNTELILFPLAHTEI